jgi:cobalt-zinc-cadmium efflux system protein
LLVAGYILYNVFGNLKSVLLVFLQSVPDDFDAHKLESELLSINGVKGVHDVHSWSMDGNYHILSLHLVVSASSDRNDLIRIRKEAAGLTRRSGINHPTIALEFENEGCDMCQ